METRQKKPSWPWLLMASAAVALVGALTLGGCSKAGPGWPPDAKGKRIMTSFAPIYCFVANVAGDDATVRCLLNNTGPHDYQPTPRDAIQLKNADVFFINGLELDSEIAKRLAGSSGNPNLKVVSLGNCPRLKSMLRAVDPNNDSCCGVHHGDTDPHIWLGVPEAIAMVECIRDELKQLDPEHAAGFEKRAAEYILKLQALQSDGDRAFAAKQDKNFITFHDSLQYFARGYGLKVVASIQPMAGAEPDAGRFARLVEICKKDKVRVLAVEPQYGKSAATALLHEIHAKGVPDAVFATVDPIETALPDQLQPDFYEKKMRENIENLSKAMR